VNKIATYNTILEINSYGTDSMHTPGPVHARKQCGGEVREGRGGGCGVGGNGREGPMLVVRYEEEKKWSARSVHLRA
jgi:hypothetical protein